MRQAESKRTSGSFGLVLVVLRLVLQAAAGSTTAVTLAAFAGIAASAQHDKMPWTDLIVWAIAYSVQGAVNALDPALLQAQDMVVALAQNKRVFSSFIRRPYESFLSAEERDYRDRAVASGSGLAQIYAGLSDQANSVGAAVGYAGLIASISPLVLAVVALVFIPLGVSARCRHRSHHCPAACVCRDEFEQRCGAYVHDRP